MKEKVIQWLYKILFIYIILSLIWAPVGFSKLIKAQEKVELLEKENKEIQQQYERLENKYKDLIVEMHEMRE